MRGFALVLLGVSCAQAQAPSRGSEALPRATVLKTADFTVTGHGSNVAWNKAEWISLSKRGTDGLPYEARFKILYSETGLYVLFDGTDRKLTTTGRVDFENLWEEDVYEAFFWPDESEPLYFEYEISPMNAELPILVPNNGGAFMGWLPWHFEKDRRTRKATSVRGGIKAPGASVEGWSAEVFIPFALFRGLKNQPPNSGTQWRANFYRMDYDAGKATQWDWARVGPSFHEYEKFGRLVFD